MPKRDQGLHSARATIGRMDAGKEGEPISRASEALLGRLYSSSDPDDVEPTFEQGHKDAVEGFCPRLFPNISRAVARVYLDGWLAGRDEYLAANPASCPGGSAKG